VSSNGQGGASHREGGGQSAIDEDVGAGDKGGEVAGKVEDGIGRTYLETSRNGGGRTLVDVATELKVGESAARMRRDRAFTRIARYLDAQTRAGQRLAAVDAQAPDRAEDLTRADLAYSSRARDAGGQADWSGSGSALLCPAP
jgi:hypothetical protein